MPRLWPALALHFPAGTRASLGDRALAVLDDFHLTALADEGPVWRAYFGAAPDRDAAAAALVAQLGPEGLRVEPIEESDEDWARRSQEGLEPVRVGRFLVLSARPDSARGPREDSESSSATARARGGGAPRALNDVDVATLVIEPSTGFGTGHHASTRLCLRLLQQLDVRGATVLDVGCGSGILAIAASLSGASRATGLDVDPDAVDAARRNLVLNPGARTVDFAVADICQQPPGRADVVFGNLTGAFLVRHAPALVAQLAPGGHAVLSGILAEEEDAVRRAFRTLALVDVVREDEWLGLLLRSL